jgi:spore maturation protein CgeB
MRIFYAADHEPFPGNPLWHNNLYLPLADLGHEIISFNYDLTPHFQHADPSVFSNKVFIEENRPRLEKALLRQIEAEHRRQPVDVFFSYFYNAFCRPEVIREIRSMGICTINWYCNASYQFHLVNEIAPAYNYCLVPERFRLEDYRRAGACPIYCQEAANPQIYKPYPLKQDFDVTFVGQKYGERPAAIEALLNGGLDVRVWGAGWVEGAEQEPPTISFWTKLKYLATVAGMGSARRRMERILGKAGQPAEEIILPPGICGLPLGDDEMIKIYSRSRINLGFAVVGETHLAEQPIKQVRLRDFEVPMSGGFYLVGVMAELEDFFEPGREIVCYDGLEDLVDKASYYLNHDEDRECIRLAGLARALSDHTWQKRFSNVFKQIGLGR